MLQIPPARLIIQIQHTPAALPEQQTLGDAVVLHGTVVVQMVLGQVGEHPHLKGQALQPVLYQGVGGRLQHHMGAAGVRHGPQQLLQLIAVRRGAVGRQFLLPHQIPVGADKPHLGVQGSGQQFPNQVGGRGLSVGPGNGNQRHLLSGAAEPVGADPGHGPTGFPGNQPRAVPLRRQPAEHRRCPPLQSLGNISSAIGQLPGQSRKQRPGFHRSAVTGYGIYFHIQVYIRPNEGHAVQKIVQLHPITPHG